MTIIHTKIAMYPIHLPKTVGYPATWINLANVLTVEYNPEQDKKVVAITFITGKTKAYYHSQAEAILKALDEAHQKYCKE